MFSLCSHRVKRIEKIEISFSTRPGGHGEKVRDGVGCRLLAGRERNIRASGTKTISGA
jgi:hypothetical protein